jgi:hypothetical protein
LQSVRPVRRVAELGSFGGWTRMIHLRIIGSIWMVSSIVPAVKLAIELWSLAARQPPGATADTQGVGFWTSQVLVEISFLLVLLTGWGLFRLRRWSVAAGGFLGVISLAICAWFILTQGTQHGPEPYVAIWCGVALSVYTIFGVWRFGRRNQLAEPSAAPNGGPATPPGNSGVPEGPPSVS